MAVHRFTKNLFLIDLDQPLEGFRNFIGSWLFINGADTIVVDPGPSSSVPVLVDTLKKQKIDGIDYILLTHIHIDHAGGAGMLLKYYPDAKVVCHPDGIRHMTNPSRLWEKTKEVLGGLAEAYGKIEPVSKECIVYSDRIETGDTAIDVIGTPGHAFHHLCYHAGENFFIGEAAGVTYPLEEGLYLRLSTPPVFEYEIYRDSLKKVASVKASNICFAHYGFRQDAENIFHAAFAQLDRWLSVVEENYCLGKGLSDEDIFDKILESDRTMALYDKLPSDVQYREKYFALNSVRGIKNYLAKKTGHSFSAEDRSPDFAGKG